MTYHRPKIPGMDDYSSGGVSEIDDGVPDLYNSGGEKDEVYNEHAAEEAYKATDDAYSAIKGSKEDDDPLYNTLRPEDEDEKKDSSGIEEGLEDPDEKYRSEDSDGESIPKRAAKELFAESPRAAARVDKKQKSTIEDAIVKAIEAEKVVIILNR